MSNTNWGTTGLIATTVEHMMPTLEEQVFTSTPLAYALKQAGQIQNVPGGLSIVQDLIYAEAANVGSYSDYDVFATDPNVGISAAEFPWRQFYGLFHYSGIEAAMNSGEEAILRLIESRMKQLELSMSEELERQMFDDGSGNSGKDIDGLAAVVNDANPSWGNLGGIDRSSNAYWRSVAVDHAGDNGSTAGLLQSNMRNLYNSISKGREHPSIGIATQEAFELYEGELIDQARFADQDMADGGFQSLLFKGMPITFSEYADYGFTNSSVADAEDPIWFLNLDYLGVRYLADTWFSPQEPKGPVNQDATYQYILCYLNLVVLNASRQGVLHSVTAAA